MRYNGQGNDRDAILAYLSFNEVGFASGVYTPNDVKLDGTVRYKWYAHDQRFPAGNAELRRDRVDLQEQANNLLQKR